MSIMKNNHKDLEHIYSSWNFSKLMAFILLLITISYLCYSLRFVTNSYDCSQTHHISISHISDTTTTTTTTSTTAAATNSHSQEEEEDAAIVSTKLEPFEETNISHIVFGIGASAKLWKQRKEYIKLWWKPNQMRGIVWLEEKVKTDPSDEKLLPQLKISEDTSRFNYKNPKGHRSAIRISRIVSETLRLGLKNVRWFVMGDDDTVFVTENLVKVLQKYDHNQYYYIGSNSESHLQNIYFSYNMAYGGGGFAISYPLALALEKIQDRCIQRYPGLYGSDDRIQACMAELGVPLTKERGFHQFDVYGNLFGLLAAHPVTPLVSLHHLDIVEPIFPNVSRVQALKRLKVPMQLDPAGLMQQSICYDKTRTWTISVSWGYAVQIFRGIFSAREMEMPARTFLNWYKRADYTAYPFNTRPVSRNVCQKPFVYYLSNAAYNKGANETASRYVRTQSNPACKWKMEDPTRIKIIEVYKKPDPHLWDKSPRRNCCRVRQTKKKGTLVIHVGECIEDEIVEL
ncbi:hypothetical protein HN51_046184 [Arachis hypogaea]|uniref:Uncharacterized protein n=1 Tax=Arachis hypogaea TaxID=3818 RepID=A0A445ABM2_ARAHY|nr:uncharacterized protein LOC107621797 [Arachis ipaensis]XP_025631428.1 uncharacterized protein LOC112726308 [Arachis hypogaea]QHO22257.1 Beta-1,3-N-acetylglucosaminyltransferase lunatic fringe [Arachis hypogaea]RYR23863.1 hypothetical protein Ahy_B02g057361 [Arachis hypogaea]